MIIEVRTYRVNPGPRERFHDLLHHRTVLLNAFRLEAFSADGGMSREVSWIARFQR